VVAFENFVGDAGKRAGDALSVEDDGHWTPLCVLAGTR
jgi:hypothetical protein